MKIEIDWALCDGNGICAIEAPEHFELNDDDELQVLSDEAPPGDTALDRAVTACPKHAITLLDQPGDGAR